MWKIGAFAIALVICAWVYLTYQPTHFPKALLIDGKPAHPLCVLATQFGDSSRLEPFLLYSTLVPELNSRISDYKQELDYSRLSEGIVKAEVQYHCNWRDPENDLEEEEVSYQAWHVSDNIALVKTKHFCTSGSGVFSELGLVKREGNSIRSYHEIAAGDRAHGTINVNSFENGILQFTTSTTPAGILSLLASTYEVTLEGSLTDYPFDYAGYIVWQCHIEGESISTPKQIQLVVYTDPT